MKNTLYLLFFCCCLSGNIFGQTQTVGIFLNDSLSLNGYTLFSPGRTTYLIDNCGRQINSWRSNFAPGLSAYLLENGDLVRAASINADLMGAGAGGRIERFDWEGNLQWMFDYNSVNVRQHHDIEVLPNGNILILAWEVFSKAEAVAAGRDPDGLNKDLWPDHIVEVKPLEDNGGEIVWEWHVWDHLIQDFDSTKANYGVVADHPELIDINFSPVKSSTFPGVTGEDWMHGNGLSYNAQRDEIVLSIRNFNEIVIIDHSTSSEEAAGHSGGRSGRGGDIFYRWGNPQSYRMGDSTQQRFFQQHDPRWIPEGHPHAGKIMVYSNGNNRVAGEYSSVEIIDPPLDEQGRYVYTPGEAYGPTQSTWTYDGQPDNSFYSPYMSGAQALPNGNTLICVARDGLFFEITPEEKIVWEYISPVGNNGPVTQGGITGFQNVFRATRFPADHPAFVGKDLTPGDPVELQPWPLNCEINGPKVATTNLASPSAPLHIINPIFDQTLQIEHRAERPLQLEIWNLSGQRIYSKTNWQSSISIPTNQWARGMYLVKVRDRQGQPIWIEKAIK